MARLKKIAVLLFMSALAVSANAELYKWVDENGEVHFSDKKPAGQDYEEKEYDTSVSKTDEVAKKHQRDMDKYLDQLANKREIEQKEKSEKVSKTAKNQGKCTRFKKSYEKIKDKPGYYTRDKEGRRKLFGQAERDALEQKIKENC